MCVNWYYYCVEHFLIGLLSGDFFPFFTTILLTSEEIVDHHSRLGCPEQTWFNGIVFMSFVYLFIQSAYGANIK